MNEFTKSEIQAIKSAIKFEITHNEECSSNYKEFLMGIYDKINIE